MCLISVIKCTIILWIELELGGWSKVGHKITFLENILGPVIGWSPNGKKTFDHPCDRIFFCGDLFNEIDRESSQHRDLILLRRSMQKRCCVVLTVLNDPMIQSFYADLCVLTVPTFSISSRPANNAQTTGTAKPPYSSTSRTSRSSLNYRTSPA